MRALSWKEPFATLMLHGKIETRTWSTKYRGLVLICASKVKYNKKQLTNISGHDIHIMTRIQETLTEDFYATVGHAIGVGELVDCRRMKLEDEDDCFVKYYPDIWCHVYENVRAIEPIPYKGQQGWKRLEEKFINQIKYK